MFSFNHYQENYRIFTLNKNIYKRAELNMIINFDLLIVFKINKKSKFLISPRTNLSQEILQLQEDYEYINKNKIDGLNF